MGTGEGRSARAIMYTSSLPPPSLLFAASSPHFQLASCAWLMRKGKEGGMIQRWVVETMNSAAQPSLLR